MKVVFIPGLLCTNKVWGELNSIREKYECVDADVYSFNSISEMSRALAKQFPNEKLVVLGMSMGGYVAIDLALQEPSLVKKLILINTTCCSVDSATIPVREKGIELAKKGMLTNVLKMNEGVCYYQPKAEWLSLEKEMAKEVGPEVYIRQQKAIISRNDYSESIKNINCDTLIFSSKEDKIFPFNNSVYMFENIPKSNLILLSECGHLSTLEKGNLVKSYILSFLES